jgi:hypothetical protein
MDAPLRAVDLYSKVPMCNHKLQWSLCVIEAVSTLGTFFNITADALRQKLLDNGVDFAWDQLREDCISAYDLPFFYSPGNADEARAECERLKTMRNVVARCFIDSGADGWIEAVRDATDADELDRLLKIGQKNKFLKSFLWALPAKEFGRGSKDHFLASEHFSAAMVKYDVPLHPHHLPLFLTQPRQEEVVERAWSCHFVSMHNHVVRCRRMIKKKHAFAKLYHRCFARAFKDPLGKARKRENETAATDFEEHLAKRALCE